MMSTSRASRSSKEKPTRTQQTAQNVKSEGPPKGQQATAEQMRIANIMADKGEVDTVLQGKMDQVMELTGRTKDEVVVALHDCDNDTNRAINMLLEGETDQGEWQETGKRRKRNQPATKTAEQVPTNQKSDKREKSKDRDREDKYENGPPRRNRPPPRLSQHREEWSESGPPSRKSGQPPRFARKAQEQEENERNRNDSRSRDRSFERGRGRGRGSMNGPGRGRGRGRRDRSDRSNRFGGDRGGDQSQGPQIGTWTNETAENAEKENSKGISSWGDTMTEDWGDEWAGSLEESKVFTASETGKGVFSTGMGDNDAKMFTAPPPAPSMDSQVFTATNLAMPSSSPNTAALPLNNSTPGGTALNDATNTLHTAASLQNSMAQNSQGQNSISQNTFGQSSITQNSLGLNSSSQLPPSTLGQRLDLGMLLQKPTDSQAPSMSQPSLGQQSMSQQQSQFMSQFTKQATESIKNAVGIGSSSPTAPQQQVLGSSPRNSQSGGPNLAACAHVGGQRQKPARSKLPPPSKIPASAVEMPGHIGSFQLDVQFGNWDNAPSDSGFTFGGGADLAPASYATTGASTTTTASLNNHLSQVSSKMAAETTSVMTSVMTPSVMSNVSSNKTPVTSLDSITQQQQGSRQSPGSTVFQNSSSANTTPNKNYPQSSLSQSNTNKMSPPDPIPFPGSQDRKTSPHYSQRSAQSTGGMVQSKSATSPSMTFSQSNYSSSYQSAGYQSGKPAGNMSSTTSTYSSHSGSNLSGQSALQMSNSQNQYSHQPYQTASFQNQNSYSSNQGQNSLYQNSQQNYPSQSSSSYQSGSNSYHSRDNQSNNAYPSTASQSGSSYQSGPSQASYQSGASSQSGSSYPTNVTQSNSSSYQRDSQSSQSGYGSHQTYGSTNHQNSLQSSQMTMSANKLTDNLQKMSVKDTALDSHQSSSQYDHTSSSTSTASLTTTTTTTSLANTSVNVSAALGLTSTSAPAATTTPYTSSTKTSLPLTSKAPPNLPPGVPPLISHNYAMIGQPGMPFAFAGLAQQPAMYSYEDLQLIQQGRLPLPPSTLPGRDQPIASVQYTGADGKLNRVEAQSPVNQAQTSQQQQQQQQAQQQTQSAHQQQAFINPATLPPGYNYYYPGNVVPGAYSYTPTVFPQVPPVTNTAHGGSTANAQFQKPGAYAAGSHTYGTATYDELSNQGQDFSKGYVTTTQAQNKASAASAVTSSATDLSSYGKTHTQSYDKTGFPTGTPPPFNLLPSGTQAAALGAPTAAYGTQYVPVMAHQAHSQQILHHHLQQDSTGGSSRGSQQSATQPKPAAKTYGTYHWGAN